MLRIIAALLFALTAVTPALANPTPIHSPQSSAEQTVGEPTGTGSWG